MISAKFNPESFLNEFWQKKPCVIRQGFLALADLISAQELAGLACEDFVDSRLVEGDALSSGPFDEAKLSKMPEKDWTLLVNQVDRHVPAVADVLSEFSFIPAWRLDDVMISFAPTGGGVGAHTDNYDVFLIQASGKRKWRVGREKLIQPKMIAGLAIQRLADESTLEQGDEYVLESGDMLYIPPGFAHDGVSLSQDCLTYSIGFRAPSCEQIVAAVTGAPITFEREDLRYEDADLVLQDEPGEITAAAFSKVEQVVRAAVRSEAGESGIPKKKLMSWLGCNVTEPMRVLMPSPEDPYVAEPLEWGEFVSELTEVGSLRRFEPVRIAFMRMPLPWSSVAQRLFINGDEYELSSELEFMGPLLSHQREIPAADILKNQSSEWFQRLMLRIYNQGHFYFPEAEQ